MSGIPMIKQFLKILFIVSMLVGTAQANGLQDILDSIFGKLDKRLAVLKGLPLTAETPLLLQRPYASMEVILHTAGITEASINGAEPNGLTHVGLADIDGDGIEEMILSFNMSPECQTQQRCLTLVYKAVDAGKTKYRRIFGATTLMTAGTSVAVVSRGLGKLRAIESRKDGRVIDRFEP